jgi:hypothetical protein
LRGWRTDEGQVRRLLVAEADLVRGVLAVVVADEHLVDAVPQLGRDPVEHVGERGGGVVRHHEDPDLGGHHAALLIGQ